MKTINRHNYETWFLLWIDGELSTEEMDAVERFIANNPGLAEELAFLQETRLPIDETIVFPNKESLLKQESDTISLTNYETYFLLYVDNELSESEKQATELFVLQHPGLQESFLLLQQTKLAAETISFGDKSVLYRKEEKRRPVIFMRWSSVAVAAAMFGLVATLWMVVPQDNLQERLAIAAENTTVKTKTKELSNEEINARPNMPVELGEGPAKAQISRSVNQPINNSTAKRESGLTVDQPTTTQPEEATASVEKKLNNNQQSETEAQPKETIAANNNNAKSNLVEENKEPETLQIGLKNNTDAETTASLIKPAVYKELDTNDDDKSLYIGVLEINKDKLRGFLRKAGSVFRSKSKQEEDTRPLK